MYPFTVVHPSIIHIRHFTNIAKTWALNTRLIKRLFQHKHGYHTYGITLLNIIWNPPTCTVALPSNIPKYLFKLESLLLAFKDRFNTYPVQPHPVS